MVFVVKNDVVERRAVKTGSAAVDTIEVLAGLVDGEQVVVSGSGELNDGRKVVVKK